VPVGVLRVHKSLAAWENLHLGPVPNHSEIPQPTGHGAYSTYIWEAEAAGSPVQHQVRLQSEILSQKTKAITESQASLLSLLSLAVFKPAAEALSRKPNYVSDETVHALSVHEWHWSVLTSKPNSGWESILFLHNVHDNLYIRGMKKDSFKASIEPLQWQISAISPPSKEGSWRAWPWLKFCVTLSLDQTSSRGTDESTQWVDKSHPGEDSKTSSKESWWSSRWGDKVGKMERKERWQLGWDDSMYTHWPSKCLIQDFKLQRLCLSPKKFALYASLNFGITKLETGYRHHWYLSLPCPIASLPQALQFGLLIFSKLPTALHLHK
jgi:hypothetical protein